MCLYQVGIIFSQYKVAFKRIGSNETSVNEICEPTLRCHFINTLMGITNTHWGRENEINNYRVITTLKTLHVWNPIGTQARVNIMVIKIKSPSEPHFF